MKSPRLPVLLLLGAAALAAAQGADPTRPPAALLGGAESAPAGKAPRAAAPASAPAPALPVLQSVQIQRDGVATALIDARLLRVGDAAGSAWRVAAIDAAGVLLKDAKGRELRLALGGNVIRTPATSAADAAAPGPSASKAR